jgi:hypothetical protein
MKFNKKTIEVLYVPNEHKDYIERLNKFLNPNNNPYVTTAMWNKQITFNGVQSKFFRPLTVFDYDCEAKSQLCFAYSSPKLNDNPNDLTYFILPNKTKIMLNNAILIPTSKLKIIDFNKEISSSNSQQLKKWLIETEKDYKLVRTYSSLILEQYRTIKYCIDKNKFDYRDVQRANSKMIDESKVERFCRIELKNIEQQELLSKSNRNQGGGSSGTPIEENSDIQSVNSNNETHKNKIHKRQGMSM